MANFLQAVRANDADQLNADILQGHRSTLLCHLGNIAQRVNRVAALRRGAAADSRRRRSHAALETRIRRRGGNRKV